MIFLKQVETIFNESPEAYKKLLEVIFKIPDQKFDETQSSINITNNFCEIICLSLDNASCKFQLRLGRNDNLNKMFFILGDNGVVVYYEDLLNIDDAEFYFFFILRILTSKIQVVSHQTKGEVRKRVYTILNNGLENSNEDKYIEYIKTIWLWQKASVKKSSVLYAPWI